MKMTGGGDLVYIVHGSNAHTWWRRLANGGYPWWRRWSLFCFELRQALGRDCEVREFRWSGGNTHQARMDAGADLARTIESEDESRRIHLVGHSHGGNVALAAANHLHPRRVETLILLANPHMAIAGLWVYWGKAVENVPHIWNLYSPQDNVQCSLARTFHGLNTTSRRDVLVHRTYDGSGHDRVQNGVIHWSRPLAAHRAMHSGAVGAVAGALLRRSTFAEAMKAAGLSIETSNEPRDRGGFPGLEKTQQFIREAGNPNPFDIGNAQSDVGILFIHGFTASPAEVRPMAEYLAKHTNWRCKAILLPGHGTIVEDMQKSGGEDWIAAAEKAYDDLSRECGHVFVAGVSLGATICCHVGLRRRNNARLRGLILIAPAFGISLRKSVGVRLLGPFIRLRKKNRRASDYFLDHRLYSYVHNPLNRAAEVLDLGREALRRLSELKELPVVLFTGDLDSTVSLDKIHAAARGNPWIRLVRLPKSRHILTVEPDRERMFEATVKFVEECLGGGRN
jgi:carboxylesterase